MIDLEGLKKDRDLINSIDWDMTPEEAVRLYLEWGNNWSRGNVFVRSRDDISHYFVINSWGEKPVIYLIKRNSDEANELAEIEPPDDLVNYFIKYKKGVYALEGKLKSWLMEELEAA